MPWGVTIERRSEFDPAFVGVFEDRGTAGIIGRGEAPPDQIILLLRGLGQHDPLWGKHIDGIVLNDGGGGTVEGVLRGQAGVAGSIDTLQPGLQPGQVFGAGLEVSTRLGVHGVNDIADIAAPVGIDQLGKHQHEQDGEHFQGEERHDGHQGVGEGEFTAQALKKAKQCS